MIYVNSQLNCWIIYLGLFPEHVPDAWRMGPYVEDIVIQIQSSSHCPHSSRTFSKRQLGEPGRQREGRGDFLLLICTILWSYSLRTARRRGSATSSSGRGSRFQLHFETLEPLSSAQQCHFLNIAQISLFTDVSKFLDYQLWPAVTHLWRGEF